MRWDIFCKVIDNHGDLGVCWRLARGLAARGHAVRLWVDDARALAWMAPGALQGAFTGITVLPWTQPLAPLPDDDTCADVWVEAFGCDIEPQFIAHHVQRVSAQAAQPPVWINLEYLSAQPYVERMHALPSPVLHGPAAGWTKWFFYPGFTARTGGLLREDDLQQQQAAFDRAAWRRARGIAEGALAASLFCYEPPALPELLAHWRQGAQDVHLLVTAGRAADAARYASPFPRKQESMSVTSKPAPMDSRLRGNDEGKSAPRTYAGSTPAPGLRPALSPAPLPQAGEGNARRGDAPSRHALRLAYLRPLTQTDYDRLLWMCDLNFVRGEDSLVRALWAGQPFVWQIYPQEDGAHHAKLQAFLDWLQAPPGLRDFHRVWNGMAPPPLPAPQPDAWRECVRAARTRLLAQPDLVSQLIGFVRGKQTSR
ncbi:MAG: elongation factor P maturation arginine rhamnosyltransferase EarP [Burkholderiaceae bacterium]|jgi:hypothetical protein|nr:elongation factor P maturation arginine rhamnosyltransferase EarP [Burkholderiaceae bacterium]